MGNETNEGVRLLISRMESHPEEFGKYGRWHETLSHAINDDFLSEDEINQIKDKLREKRRDQFVADVMTQLMGEEEKDPVDMSKVKWGAPTPATPGSYVIYGGSGGGAISNGIANPAMNSSLGQHYTNQLAAQQAELKAQYEQANYAKNQQSALQKFGKWFKLVP